MSPERINTTSKKVTKKISAVPKSLISASKPTQTTEKMINSIKLRLVCNLSSALAPIKINIVLTNSEGWNEMEPIYTQLAAPFVTLPSTILDASSSTANIITGKRILSLRSGSSMNLMITQYKTMPMAAAISCT